jgi:hypothetical protein
VVGWLDVVKSRIELRENLFNDANRICFALIFLTTSKIIIDGKGGSMTTMREHAVYGTNLDRVCIKFTSSGM